MSSSGQKRSGAQVAMPQPVARALRRLGQDISVTRRMRRLSQEDLAQRIGTSLSTVRRLEEMAILAPRCTPSCARCTCWVGSMTCQKR